LGDWRGGLGEGGGGENQNAEQTFHESGWLRGVSGGGIR
jgi:hypothetical protein